MAHTSTSKKQLLSRVRRIKGQATALERALDEETECTAVLQQIAAIRGAINGLMAEVLEGQVREHFGSTGEDMQHRQDDLEQIIRIMRSYLR